MELWVVFPIQVAQILDYFALLLHRVCFRISLCWFRDEPETGQTGIRRRFSQSSLYRIFGNFRRRSYTYANAGFKQVPKGNANFSSSFVFYIYVVDYQKITSSTLLSLLVERAEQRYAESYQAAEKNDEKSRLCSVLQVGISLVVNIQLNKSRRIFDKSASSSSIINYYQIKKSTN